MNQSTTTNLTQSGEIEFAAFVAIDWADREHAWAMEVPDNSRRERGKLAQTSEAIEEWAMGLAARFQGRPIAVALEQARGALLYALSQYGHLVLFPIHPNTSSSYRTALYPSGAKDDPKDAELLLDLLVKQRNRLRPLHPDTPETRKLQALVEKRRRLVDQKTAYTNRITAELKLYFPQVLDWFDEMDSPLVAAFVQRWPSLPQLQAEAPEQILKFLHQHNCRSKSRNRERLEQIAQARPLTLDAAVVEPAVLLVPTLLQIVQALRVGIASLERAIAAACAEHPDFAVFDSFPGAGPALAPRLLAAFGSQRERFSSAGEMQTFSGIAPVISRSGKSKWTHFRWACPKFLRQTFHEYADSSIQFSEWARTFYDKQRTKGKGHHAAVRSLAFKWIRILYRCWFDGIPYSEERHLASLAVRAKPAETAAEGVRNAVEGVWKKTAGFWKFSVAEA
jgi:transposase